MSARGTIAARLNALEKQLAPGERRDHTLYQFLKIVEYTNEHGYPSDWDAVVGPPSRVLQPGQRTLAEMLSDCFPGANEGERGEVGSIEPSR